ncbi:MAG TPA: DUF3857 domain-containing protein [Candidatus Solibacter sp.]|nr:DUF3857 domain-containing protein [Candidatus Solibacter sp.]
MLRWHLSLSLVLSSCMLSLSLNGKDDTGGWNVPRFAADGAPLYKAASSVTPKPGTDVIVLDEESSYVFDADGKSVRTEYLVYKVLTENGASGWDAIAVGWEPWHGERPSIRARVITADNVVHTLDAKTITDAPAADSDEKTYGDGRIVRAPLPAIAIGSVVEEEEVLRESAPFFGAGTVSLDYFGRGVPVQNSKLTLDAPSALPLRYETKLLPDVKPQKSESNGRTQIIFRQGPMDALDSAENYLPADVPSRPEIRFSTGASWQAIAEGYAKIVDEKASTKEVQTLVNGLVAGKTTRQERASAIVEYLSREIRYTGVEFGDAAIVPHAQSETLKRKYGDCKDKATLGVAMLRAAGIPAFVALLNVGARADVDTELPGMGMFDHAIVYAPGTPDLWMDLTDEHARLGQLPNGDGGRLALVARAETTGLVKVPEASSQDNLIVEKRDIFLAENGPARVVETTEPHGVFESQFRAAYADADNKDNRKSLKDYLAYEYLADNMTRVERSDPANLSTQFELKLEAGKAKRGSTDLEVSVAAIRVESLFDRLPQELTVRDKDEEKDDDPSKDKPKKPRVGDYQLPVAYSYEWQYRILPPDGFQAKPLPPNMKTSLGPATMSEEFAKESDGSVRATIQFDTGKRRITAAEAKELKEKVAEAREGAPVMVYFEPIAEALMNEGKMREGFEASRSLIAKHPKDAVPHLRRAKMLLAAGMGKAARDEAMAATQLEPGSALAQKTLAGILEYDLLGRQFQRGSDYAGAEAAFRAAQKLDKDDNEIPGNLAILLEYNGEGERYGPGAKLKESVAEYRSLTEEQLAKIGVANNLAFTLFYAGDFAGAQKYSESLNPQLSSVIVAAETALHGAEAGMTEARKRTASEADLKTVLMGAGGMLMRARIYAPAADLMAAGASGNNASNTMALAAMLRKAVPHETIKAEDTPSNLVKRMFLMAMEPDITEEKLDAFESRNAKKVTARKTPEEIERTLTSMRSIRRSISRMGLPADVMVDIIMTAMQEQAEGDDASGYRVTLTPMGTNKTTMWVVKEDGKYRVLDSADKPNSVALEILDRVQAGNNSGAKVLLDWVREEEHLAGGDDPLAGYAFPRMWTKGKEAAAETMKIAAAAILAQTAETAGDGVKILEAARTSAKSDAEKLNLDIDLLSAYSNLSEYQKLEAKAAEMAKEYPESKTLFFDREIALRAMGKYGDADSLAQEMSKRLPEDTDIARAFIYTAVAREDYAKAHELGEKLAASGKAEANDLNEVAWTSLFTGKVSPSDLDTAIKSAELSQSKNAGILHTLGCVYAEIGKTKEALEVLLQAMDQLALDEPDPNYWYAFGRVAEQYGENEVARADYKQVKKPEKALQVPGSSYRLAQMRLATMDGRAQK